MPDQEIIPASAPNPGGRPLSYTDEIGQEICDRLSIGESLIQITRDDHMPSEVTVYRWLRREDLEGFCKDYARARENQADHMADEMQEIADDGRNDWMEIFGKDGESIGWRVNGEAVARSKMRWQDRQWRAGQLRPKVWGTKVDLTSSDGSMTPKGLEDFYAQPPKSDGE